MCWTPICFARASRLPTNSASSMLFSCILAVANYVSAQLTRAQLRAYSMLSNASDLEVSFKKQFRHEGFFASLMLIGEALPVPGTIDMKRGGRESCGARLSNNEKQQQQQHGNHTNQCNNDTCRHTESKPQQYQVSSSSETFTASSGASFKTKASFDMGSLRFRSGDSETVKIAKPRSSWRARTGSRPAFPHK